MGSMLSTETMEVETSTCSYEEDDLEVKSCQRSTTQISSLSFDFGFLCGSSRTADPIVSQRYAEENSESKHVSLGYTIRLQDN